MYDTVPRSCRLGGGGLHRGLAPLTANVSNIASKELLQIGHITYTVDVLINILSDVTEYIV